MQISDIRYSIFTDLYLEMVYRQSIMIFLNCLTLYSWQLIILPSSKGLRMRRTWHNEYDTEMVGILQQ